MLRLLSAHGRFNTAALEGESGGVDLEAVTYHGAAKARKR
jgi:hypothetical protein